MVIVIIEVEGQYEHESLPILRVQIYFQKWKVLDLCASAMKDPPEVSETSSIRVNYSTVDPRPR